MLTSLFREARSMHGSTTAFTALAAIAFLMAQMVIHAWIGHLIPWASFIHRAVPIHDALAMSWAVCAPLAVIGFALADAVLYGFFYVFVFSDEWYTIGR